MSDTDPLDAKLVKRQEILDELWALVGGPEHPGSVQVAALDRIARIEGAYTPIKIETKKKFTSLADFYAGVAVADSQPASSTTDGEDSSETDDEENEDDY